MPVSATLRVPAPLPALTLRLAFFVPGALALNTTLMLQLAPAATGAPQVLVCENGWGLVVESPTLVMERLSVPVFVTVIACGALAMPVA